jgi:hypothetical protein
MCHVNLDMKQANIEQHYGVKHAMPIYYLSDVVGLALGFEPKALGVSRHFVPGVARSADLQASKPAAGPKSDAPAKDAAARAGATAKT